VREKDFEMGTMRVIDSTGDTKIIWDATKEAEVENARRTFNDLRKKKYNAYAVKKDGEKGSVVTEFDPDAEKIIMAPPMAGG
jgi:hypothetical protein